jgi:hypothetical protein
MERSKHAFVPLVSDKAVGILEIPPDQETPRK